MIKYIFALSLVFIAACSSEPEQASEDWSAMDAMNNFEMPELDQTDEIQTPDAPKTVDDGSWSAMDAMNNFEMPNDSTPDSEE